MYIDLYRFISGFPYTAHRAHITPPPYFLFSYCFYAYFRLGLVKLSQGQACPTGLENMFSQGPAGQELEKKRIIKNKWRGGYLCSKSKTRNCPDLSINLPNKDDNIHKQQSCFENLMLRLLPTDRRTNQLKSRCFAYWLEESSPKFETFILNWRREKILIY